MPRQRQKWKGEIKNRLNIRDGREEGEVADLGRLALIRSDQERVDRRAGGATR